MLVRPARAAHLILPGDFLKGAVVVSGTLESYAQVAHSLGDRSTVAVTTATLSHLSIWRSEGPLVADCAQTQILTFLETAFGCASESITGRHPNMSKTERHCVGDNE